MAICGVDAKEYSAYTFTDHLWAQAGQTDLLELAQRCVVIDGEYYLQAPNSGLWERYKTLPLARAQAVNTWLGGRLSSGTIIDYDLIKTFFTGKLVEEIQIGTKVITKETAVGSCPMLHGFIVIPFGPRFVVYNGRPYLNMAVMNMQDGVADDLMWGRALLRLIYRSLCDGPALSDDPVAESHLLWDQVASNRYTNIDFRFILNWLAALVQRPGINLQTNLWLVGRQQGVGKGTLSAVMRTILGDNMVGSLNQTEIESGWNDHITGKVLMVCDEMGDGRMSKREWDRWIKTHTCEATLNVRRRNYTASSVLNIGNYLFTTNLEQPSYMDVNDRRNVVIKTTDDRFGPALASLIRRRLNRDPDHHVAAGFAYVLEQVTVHYDLLDSAYMNQAKANVVAAQIEHVEMWAREDGGFERDVWVASSTLFERFQVWFKDNFPGEKVPNVTEFGTKLKTLFGRGVEKGRKNSGQAYRIGEILDVDAADQRELAAADLAAITQIETEYRDYDQPVEAPMAVQWDGLSAMERMRLRLAAEKV